MKFLPNTLFWRLFLLILGFMLCVLVVIRLIFALFVAETAGQQLAVYSHSIILFAQEVNQLGTTDSNRRFADQLQQSTGMILRQNANQQFDPIPDKPLFKMWQNSITQRLANEITMSYQNEPQQIVWFNHQKPPEFSLGMPSIININTITNFASISLLVAFILSLFSASVAAYFLNRPLRALAEKAKLIGQDIDSIAIEPSGPNEIRAVALAMNKMHADLDDMKHGILESSPDAIFSVDNDGLIKNYNPSTLSIFGYTHQEIHEKNWIGLFIAEPFRDNDLLNHSKYTESSKDSVVNSRIELMGYRGDEEFPIEISITPIRIGSLNFFSVFIRDISERKHAEAVLREGQQQAEQANLVKSQFLAMMSHEIRTPLNAVLGMQELLTHTPLNHVQSDYLKLATQSGKNLLAIVNDILDLTKVEAGKLELEQIPFDVIEITQHCVELLRLTAQAKDLSLITVIAPELNVWISGDPLRYQQVLTNLLSNAIKFTNNGSVTIKLSAQSSAEDSSALLVEVIDTGLGIPLASQAGLFEVFIQVDPSDTRKHGGSGLGLAISKRLVALWEGHIGVESTPNVGSRFWFTVGAEVIAPVLTITSALNKGDEATHPAFSANILVVDDSPINQLVMAYMLRNAGHHVDLADSGSAGIAAVKKKHYDIILMDVSMPDMSGMEATTIIRQLGGAAAVVPIIAITAHALAGYQVLCLAAGMNGYATKPISQKDLLAVVATWCDKTITHEAPALSALIEDSSVQPLYEPVKQAVILDQAALDALTSLLGQEAFNDLLQIYLRELTTRCDAIKQAVILQDLAIISREAHSIKSSSASFGATALQAIAKDIEACGYNDDLPQALILAEQLLPCAAATLAAMSSI